MALAALVVAVAVAILRTVRAVSAARREEPARARPDLAVFAAGNVILAAAALIGALPFRVAQPSAPPLAAMAGSAGYVFFAASLLLAGVALSPAATSAVSRILSATLAALGLAPALVLLFFARATDPPLPVVIGSVWQTPSALYVSSGGRGRREADSAEPVEAEIVEARSGLFGLSQQGLAGFRAAGRTIPWRGEDGISSRLAARWPQALSGPLFSVTRTVRSVEMRPNERLWILRGPAGVTFTNVEGAPSPPDVKPPAD